MGMYKERIEEFDYLDLMAYDEGHEDEEDDEDESEEDEE
jgi:hypothetical protein